MKMRVERLEWDIRRFSTFNVERSTFNGIFEVVGSRKPRLEITACGREAGKDLQNNS
jgi:hypothetical protein